MGNKQKSSASSKKIPTNELTEEEIDLLLNNTHFNRKQIEEWHTGFIVIITVFEFKKINYIQIKKFLF